MNKEILEAAKCCSNRDYICSVECPLFGAEVCNFEFAKAIIEQHERYRWHDLRKDPNDLPNPIDDLKFYELYDKSAHVDYRTVRGWWIRRRLSEIKEGWLGDRFADAWREIEPVESEVGDE